MRAKRKSCKERQLVDLINKRFKVFCNESYDLVRQALTAGDMFKVIKKGSVGIL